MQKSQKVKNSGENEAHTSPAAFFHRPTLPQKAHDDRQSSGSAPSRALSYARSFLVSAPRENLNDEANLASRQER